MKTPEFMEEDENITEEQYTPEVGAQDLGSPPQEATLYKQDGSLDLDSFYQKAFNPKSDRVSNLGLYDTSRPKPSLMDVPGAIFRQENVLSPLFMDDIISAQARNEAAREDFDYLNHIPPDLMDHAASFVFANSELDIKNTEAKVRRELRDKEIFAERPIFSLAASLPLGLIDPINLFPGAPIYRGVKRTENLAKTMGGSFVAMAGAAAAAEPILAKEQLTRTNQESAFNVLSSGIFGAAFGGAIHLGLPVKQRAEADIKNVLNNDNFMESTQVKAEMVDSGEGYLVKDGQIKNYNDFTPKDTGVGAPVGHTAIVNANHLASDYTAVNMTYENTPNAFSELALNKDLSVGAAYTNPTIEIEGQRIQGAAAERLADATSFLNPILSLSSSPFLAASKAAEQLFTQNIVRKKNLFENDGIANENSLETMIQKAYGSVGNAQRKYQEIFYEQAGIDPNSFFKTARTKFLGNPGLDFETFDKYVSRAIRAGNRHENATVQKAAKLFHDEVLEPWKNEAIKFNLLPKNVSVKTALGYLTRAYNIQKIKEQPTAFKDDIRPWFYKQNQLLQQMMPRIEAGRKNIKDANKTYKEKLKNAAEFKRLDKKIKSKGAKSLTGRIKSLQKELEQLAKPMADGTIRAENDRQIILAKEELKKAKSELAGLKRKRTNLKKDLEKLSVEDAKENIASSEESLKELVPDELRDSNGEIRKVLDEEQLEQAIDQTMLNIISRNEEKLLNPRLMQHASGKPKPLQTRDFLIPDSMIENWTLNSASDLMNIYSKSVIPTIEVARMGEQVGITKKNQKKISRLMDRKFAIEQDIKLGELVGDEVDAALNKIADIDGQIEALEAPGSASDLAGHYLAELGNEIEEMKKGKSVEEIRKLEKEFDKASYNITSGIDVILGVYGKGGDYLSDAWVRYSNNLKKINNGRLMGAVVLASIPDVASIVMRHTLMGTIQHGLIPMITKDIASIQNKEQLRDLGFAINKVTGSRIKSMLDHAETGRAPTAFDKVTDFLSTSIFNVSGMNAWQDMVQQMAGTISISRTLRAIDKWATSGKMDPKESKRLNALGLGKEHWGTVHAQFKEHGGKSLGGTHYVDHGSWNLDDKAVSEAYKAYTSAIYNEVTSSIVQPGAGDLPIAANDPTMGMLLQYKKFSISTHNKLLVSGLSYEEASYLSGVMGMLSLGAISYISSSFARDGGETLDLSPGKLAMEAVDRSGLLGVILEGFNIGQKLLGFNGVSRYQSRGLMGNFFGPSLGLVEDFAFTLNKLVRAGFDDDTDFTTNDAKKFLHLMPYQNLFYLSYLFRKATKNAALEFGATES